MEAVTRWAQDFPTLCLEVPEEDKREAICHAVECWLDTGDEEFARQLAERVFGQSKVEFTLPVTRPFRVDELVVIEARRGTWPQLYSYLRLGSGGWGGGRIR